MKPGSIVTIKTQVIVDDKTILEPGERYRVMVDLRDRLLIDVNGKQVNVWRQELEPC